MKIGAINCFKNSNICQNNGYGEMDSKARPELKFFSPNPGKNDDTQYDYAYTHKRVTKDESGDESDEEENDKKLGRENERKRKEEIKAAFDGKAMSKFVSELYMFKGKELKTVKDLKAFVQDPKAIEKNRPPIVLFTDKKSSKIPLMWRVISYEFKKR